MLLSSRCKETVRTFRGEDSDGGSGEKTNQVCEHYHARKLCFKCEKLSRESERMLTAAASPAHNGSKKEAAVSELYVNEPCNSYSAVTMSGSGSRLVGDTRRDDNIQTQQEFI